MLARFVPHHLSSLGNCSGHNGGKCTCKGKLEKPVVVCNVITRQEKISVANKCLSFGNIIASISKSIPYSPESASRKQCFYEFKIGNGFRYNFVCAADKTLTPNHLRKSPTNSTK